MTRRTDTEVPWGNNHKGGLTMKVILGTSVVAAAAIGALVVSLGSAGAQTPTGSKLAFDMATTKAHEVKFATRLNLASPVKLCSAVNDPYWRDTVSVPDSFTPEACKGYASSVGAVHYQLACISKDSVAWGALQGGTPPANSCSW